jgi:hypothetical protein
MRLVKMDFLTGFQLLQKMARSVSSHIKRERQGCHTKYQIRARIRLLTQILRSDKHDGMFSRDHIRDMENCIAALNELLYV